MSPPKRPRHTHGIDLLSAKLTVCGIERRERSTTVSECRRDILVRQKADGTILLLTGYDANVAPFLSHAERLTPAEARHLGKLLIAAAATAVGRSARVRPKARGLGQRPQDARRRRAPPSSRTSSPASSARPR